MDFSAILDSLYTKEQSIELLQVLDTCLVVEYKTGDALAQLKDAIPAHMYPLLRPIVQQAGWKEHMKELRTLITNMPLITLCTPYFLSEQSAEAVVEYVRDSISKHTLVSFVQKNADQSLAIEWKGTYGEF